MALDSVNILYLVNTDPRNQGPIFYWGLLTLGNAQEAIKAHYPDIQHHFNFGDRRFFIPVIHLPGGAFHPEPDIRPRSLTHLCAALRLLGWSGNLWYDIPDGETKPQWRWSTRIVHHPHGLP